MKQSIQDIKQQARKDHVPIMMDGGIQFLCTYIKEHPEVKHILEAGTAVGYSSINMASIRKDIQIDTIELDPKMYEEAIANIKSQGLEDQIHVHLGDAALFETDQKYDLFFIDAAKAQYRNYLEHFYPNSRRGSVFIFDNLNFHGIVDNPSLSHNRSTLQMCEKIRKFRNWLLVEPRFVTTFYGDIGDGVAISKRVRKEAFDED